MAEKYLPVGFNLERFNSNVIFFKKTSILGVIFGDEQFVQFDAS